MRVDYGIEYKIKHGIKCGSNADQMRIKYGSNTESNVDQIRIKYKIIIDYEGILNP